MDKDWVNKCFRSCSWYFIFSECWTLIPYSGYRFQGLIYLQHFFITVNIKYDIDMNTIEYNFWFGLIFSEATGASRLEVQIMSKFSDHSCTVWRVSWNLTGTILSSSGDDGYVRMWKSINMNIYIYLSVPILRLQL